MADLKEKILKKYDINIDEENIFKLYKITVTDISDSELEALIEKTRKRWNQSINGANERNANRDKARLEKADKYEAILRDKKIFKELFNYYNGNNGNQSGSANESAGENLDFAREYFKLLKTSKKIKKADIDFFFEYYKKERKNKNSITEMLKDEFDIKNAKDAQTDFDDVDDNTEGDNTTTEDNDTGKKKKSVIVNLFTETTVIKLRNCFEYYEAVRLNSDIVSKYPTLQDGLYNFLQLKSFKSIDDFKDFLDKLTKEVYSLRQEKGEIYISFQDLLNSLKKLSQYNDVEDNFNEFKLLIKYPTLTPYMFAFTEMKKSTFKGFMDIASRDYLFRDETDFILSYYNPVHDNFGITNVGIKDIIKRAEKNANQNKLLNELDEKLGRRKKRKLSFVAELIHVLMYWPIFLAYFIFELVKFIFSKIRFLSIPTGIVLVYYINKFRLFRPSDFTNMTIESLANILNKKQWIMTVAELGLELKYPGQLLLYSIMYILVVLIINVLPAVFIAKAISDIGEYTNKNFDIIGYERTLNRLLDNMRQKTEEMFFLSKKKFISSGIVKAIINIICTIAVISAVGFTMRAVPAGFRSFSEKTGYFQNEENINTVDQNSDEHVSETEAIIKMKIKVKSANIRSGPGKDYHIIGKGTHGQVFESAGQSYNANGYTWYEIYLDKENNITGWAGESVIELE